MTGRIVHLSVSWATDTSVGAQQTTVDLAAMRRHCRPERMEELLDDLVMICQEVRAGQDAEGAAARRSVAPLRRAR